MKNLFILAKNYKKSKNIKFFFTFIYILFDLWCFFIIEMFKVHETHEKKM